MHGGRFNAPQLLTLEEYLDKPWALSNHPFDEGDTLSVIFNQVFRLSVPSNRCAGDSSAGDGFRVPTIATTGSILQHCVVSTVKRLVGTPRSGAFDKHDSVGHAVLAFVWPLSAKKVGKSLFGVDRGRWHVLSVDLASEETDAC